MSRVVLNVVSVPRGEFFDSKDNMVDLSTKN